MTPARAQSLSWDWSDAALGAACALPAAVVMFSDRTHGLALAVGVLPAAILGLAPRRRARLGTLAAGVLTAASLFLGGVLAGAPVVAVAALALMGVGAALLAARAPFGQVVMFLSLPLVGIGLSFHGAGKAAPVAGLMLAGSVFAYLVALLVPESSAPASPRPRTVSPTLEYGIRLGGAGATAAAIGFLLDLDHVGWACGAALLVMRPSREMQQLRSLGRVAAVTLGALAGGVLSRIGASAGVYAAAVVLALAAAAATHRSRWYVTAAFTTFLVFLLMLYSHPATAGSRFVERVGETVLGVGLAYAFALVPLPRRRRSSQLPAASSASTKTASESSSPGTR